MGNILGLVLVALLPLDKADLSSSSREPYLGSRAKILFREIRARRCDPMRCDSLLSLQPGPEPYREILFYGDGPAVRVAARCLVLLRDRITVEKILAHASAEELGAAGYPAALFGWVVGASYDARLMPPLRRLLSSQDTHTRIFALEALRVLTFLQWRIPEEEPRFANAGEVWAMRRWCYRNPSSTTDRWLKKRILSLSARMKSQREQKEVLAYFARFLRTAGGSSPGRGIRNRCPAESRTDPLMPDEQAGAQTPSALIRWVIPPDNSHVRYSDGFRGNTAGEPAGTRVEKSGRLSAGKHITPKKN